MSWTSGEGGGNIERGKEKERRFVGKVTANISCAPRCGKRKR